MARTLGTRWWQAPLVSLAAHVVGVPFWILANWLLLWSFPYPHEPFDNPFAFLGMMPVFVVPLIVVLSSFYGAAPPGPKSMTIPIITALALLLSMVLFAGDVGTFVAGALAWILLPAVAALNYPRPRDREGK